jgi:hypothetical protein
MALVYIRPDADEIDGNWVNESGSNTNLFNSIDESVASDSDYIRSGNNPANDIVKLRLGNFTSTPVEPMTVRYRFKKVVSAGETLSMKVRLIEGDSPETTIAEWEHSDVDETYVTEEQELTAPQFALISDFDDLYLEFEAVSGEFDTDALTLLSGETDGFAIDATSYDGVTVAAYVGGPVGGTVATIDTGTPANDLSNVALDASNLVQLGTSPKMVHFPTSPYVRWSSNNLQIRSQELSNAHWTTNNVTVAANDTTAPDGSATADKITANAGSASHSLYSAIVAIPTGIQTSISCYLKNSTVQFVQLAGVFDTGDWFSVVADIANGTITETAAGAGDSVGAGSIVSVGNGWYRVSVDGILSTGGNGNFSIEAVPSGTPTQGSYSNVTWSPAGTEAFWAWGAQVNRGPIATPYLVTTTAARIGIPQSYDTAAAKYGILVEPVATNLALRSEEFGTTWSLLAGSLTSNDTTAPDGSVTADKLAGSGSNTLHGFIQTIANTNAATTYSIYAKAGTNNYFAILAQQSASDLNYAVQVFDLSLGVLGQNANSGVVTRNSASIIAIGNGWYRCAVTFTQSSGANNFFIPQLASAATGNSFYSSTGQILTNTSNTIYWWGAQAELGTVATSYIPTLGSTVTRAKDAVACLASTIPNLDAALSADLDFKYIDSMPGATEDVFIGFIAGTDQNDAIRLDGPIGSWRYIINPGVANIGNGVTPVKGDAYLIALTAENNSFNYAVNGTLSTRDTAGTKPTAATNINFGQMTWTQNVTSNHFRKVVILPRAMADAELDSRTTP